MEEPEITPELLLDVMMRGAEMAPIVFSGPDDYWLPVVQVLRGDGTVEMVGVDFSNDVEMAIAIASVADHCRSVRATAVAMVVTTTAYQKSRDRMVEAVCVMAITPRRFAMRIAPVIRHRRRHPKLGAWTTTHMDNNPWVQGIAPALAAANN